MTVDDVHYVREGDQLIPAGQTPLAGDKAFGYRSSNLREWVAEKFEGNNVPKCQSISTAELRESDSIEKIAKRPKDLSAHEVTGPDVLILIVFNPVDMETFVAARALAAEVNLVYRTGASFVSTYLHIDKTPPLSPAFLSPTRTARQLEPEAWLSLGHMYRKRLHSEATCLTTAKIVLLCRSLTSASCWLRRMRIVNLSPGLHGRLKQ